MIGNAPRTATASQRSSSAATPNRRSHRRTVVAVVLLLMMLLDIAVRSWAPRATRLPANFSRFFLLRVIDDARGTSPIVLLGDSVVWGYRLPANEALGADLQRFPNAPKLLNLSFEGMNPPNEYAVLRLALARGVRPRGVFLNVNLKAFNTLDRSYDVILPMFERDTRDVLTPMEYADLRHPGARQDALDDAVSQTWRFYGMRTDFRQRLFGDADLASALLAFTQDRTGMTARARASEPQGAERYVGTYDLSPISGDNLSLRYYRKLLDLLRSEHIPAFVFATPTNHALVGPSIDDPQYHRNMLFLLDEAERRGCTVRDWDRTMPTNAFLDNDHLTPTGNRRLASLLAAELR